jgi:putative transposase
MRLIRRSTGHHRGHLLSSKIRRASIFGRELKWSDLRYVFDIKEDCNGNAIRQIGVSEVTYYRWRQEFGGLKTEQVKRLKDLELENSRLRKAVSDLTLDKLILQEAARGNF